MKLEDRLKEIEDISTYRYDEVIIRDIINNYITNINNNTYNIMKKIGMDSKKGMSKISIDSIRETVKKILNEPFLLKQEKYNNRETNGVGNVAILYEGNPYITISLSIKSLKTHNNIIFFSKSIYETNNILINILKDTIEECKYYKNSVNVLDNVTIKEVKENEYFFSKIICIDEKPMYNKVKNMFDIPVIYNGYGNISIYADNKYFKDTLVKLDEYVFENNIKLQYYNSDNIEEDINKINKEGSNDVAAIYTKDSKKAFSFLDKVKAKKIYINENPFKNYTFTFLDKDLVLNKEIYK